MKYSYAVVCIVILLLIGCVAKETPKEQKEIQEEKIEPQKEIEQPETEEPQAEPEAEEQEPVVEEPQEEEIAPEIEEPELSEEEQLKQIFGYAKTKIKSYSYRYKDPTVRQYDIYVKGNKMNIDYIPDNYNIYLDTEKKTAEKWCITNAKCGAETGKIADLDYYDTYIETPIEWLDRITEAKKIDDGVYYGKQSWKLDTNIGEIIIDSNFGFIYSIKQEDKTYSFLNAKINRVKDSDVNVPEYLLPR